MMAALTIDAQHPYAPLPLITVISIILVTTSSATMTTTKQSSPDGQPTIILTIPSDVDPVLACPDYGHNPRSNRPQRWAMLVAPELVLLYKVKIVALSETRFSEQDHLEMAGAGYTFLWGGRPKAE
ncbi:hypothetical protein SprV_0100182200 [Sparganum proliferum]